MAEALDQLRAGPPLRLSSDSEADGDDVVARMRPSTLPISTSRLAEITATADSRPLVEMAPLAPLESRRQLGVT